MTSRELERTLLAAGGIALGATALLFADPRAARRRVARASDQVRRVASRTGDAAGALSRDAAHRSRGLVARVRSRFSHDEADDRTLAERVRAAIGRAVAHPGAIEVAVTDGRLVLSGPVLRDEVNGLMAAAWAVRGVQDVESRLAVHDEAGSVPGLQGEGRPGRRRWREQWSPTTRALAIAGGTALAVAGVLYRPVGLVGTALGALLVARATGNRSLRRLAGVGGAHSVHIDKELRIAAPPSEVFRLWRDPSNFPRFMRHVKDVRAVGGNRWHWTVAGPLGKDVEWDAEIVDVEEGRRIAWHTVGDGAVRHRGRVDIEPEGGGTLLRVAMDYAPIGGVAGHAVASLFGRDAKSEMDDDLMRMKTFLETGNVPHDAAQREGAGTTAAQH